MTKRLVLSDMLCPTDTVWAERLGNGIVTLVIRDGLLKEESVAYLSAANARTLGKLLLGLEPGTPRTQGFFTPTPPTDQLSNQGEPNAKPIA